MNNICIIGRLTHDPELRKTPNGTSVCTFRLARNERYGERNRSIFVDVTAWGKLAETVAQHKRQGDQVAVSGRLDYSEFTDAQERRQHRHSIVASTVEFLARRQRGKDEGAEGPAGEEAAGGASIDDGEEVIPFG